jgi:hypothetical protein
MSERETIMDLIRNEYDPRPNLGKADYPGFEWDDGAGRIADAILADKTLLLRNHADEVDRLKDALMKLANEVSGWLSEDDAGLREVMSNTNVAVMRNRLEIAQAALSVAS